MAITPKRERFIELVMDGMSQCDAYREAFDVKPDIKIKTVYKRSSELMQDGEIKGRIREMQDKLAEKTLWTREKSVQALLKAYAVAEAEGSSQGMTGAVKELNVMHGYNAPQKISIDGELAFTRIERVIKK